MRVLHVDSGREMRGGQWQALYLVQGLAARGHQVRLLARGPLLEHAQALGLDAAPLRRLGWPDADLVHAHDARAHSLALLAARAPLLVSRRVAFPVKTGWISRWKYSRPAAFIAISECVRQTLLDAGIDSSRIAVVYDGVVLRPPASRGTRILAPATDDPRKGSALAREAAALGGFDVHFSTRLQEELNGAAVFLYLSHHEGLGSAVLLAMAAGVPVVASRVGGLTEIVSHGETGLLVDNTPASVSEAVRRMLANPADASDMAARARFRVEERFSLDAMVEGTLRVYDRILSCSRP